MSVGIYASLAGLKARLYGANHQASSADDALLQSFADEVNDFIEATTGRVLAPLPTFSSTLTGAAGSQSVTLADAAGLSVGDDLLIGLLSETHEAGEVLTISPALGQAVPAWAPLTDYSLGDVVQPIVHTGHTYRCVFAGTSHASEPTFPTNGSALADGTLIWLDAGLTSATVRLRADLANSYAGAVCQRIYVQDGFSALDDGRYLPFGAVGIVTLAALETATFTNGPFSVIPQADYFLRPSPPTPGWSFEGVEMTNVPSAGNASPVFYPGYDNVRLIGPGPCAGVPDATGFGWPSAPDVVSGIAYRVAAGAWQMRASGGSYEVAVGSDQVAVGQFLLTRSDWFTLQRFRLKTISVVG